MSLPSPLPGAVGLSHISAYDWPAADGVRGGSPHAHLTCAEAYVVTHGTGAVQTLGPEGFAETPLHPGVVAWFTPGTIHRMINGDGLRVTVIMQNSGLPEAGDAVLTFPPGVLADPGRYAEVAVLPAREGPAAEEAALRRRDLAVEGFLALKAADQRGDKEPLRAFYEAAAALLAPKVAAWRERWRDGALAVAEATGAQLDALERGDASHLWSAAAKSTGPTREAGFGMCGRRQEYEVPGTTVPTTP
ncbi:cupin domain-containing protein [Streptomyces sp. SBT349]|uniref:cupin domain-containing protein n=1 Tax=Streptomyces sp. SBT349 TaxID=1580539 RepID=UPI00066CAF7F|nr:cupin [Streptomyces sp. SBT349]